ncbi:MAG TPA: dihydrofolate reductase family protein [Capillimicrobium sp.]|jgi:dihydrofolate reductase
MRRLKLQVQVSADGYMGGAEGDMSWALAPWSADVERYVEALMGSVDTILLGRRLAEGFIPAWAARPESESEEAIDWMNRTPKVVVSNTLQQSPWSNAVIERGDLRGVVARLKGQPGGDLIAYGGSALVTSLVGDDLADELHLFVNPTAIGAGLPVFPAGRHVPLRLVGATPFACGIVALRYEPADRG